MEEWSGQLIPHVHTTLRPSLVRSDEIEVNSTSYQNKTTKLEIHSHEWRNPQGGLLLALKLEPLLNPLRDIKGEMWNDYIVVVHITSCHSGIKSLSCVTHCSLEYSLY